MIHLPPDGSNPMLFMWTANLSVLGFEVHGVIVVVCEYGVSLGTAID